MNVFGILIFGVEAGIVIGWSLIIGSLIGMIIVGALSIFGSREQHRLTKMREEADRKRDDYFVLSDKLDLPAPRAMRPRRARFLL